MGWSIEDLFDTVVERKASDLLFVPGAPPIIWVAGHMHRIGDVDLTHDDVAATFLPLLNEQQKARLERDGDVDFSAGRAKVGRFRINLHRQRETLAVAMRHIPHDIPRFEDLKLPGTILQLANCPNGLVLVTGGTGVGKSTTLASMINYMNLNFAHHIITLEDPIEFAFRHGKSIIEQREIGHDCPSFSMALRHVVRQRPDVIFVGEMRDLETISAALTAAETGHLVLASLHTSSADDAVNRMIDVFNGDRQLQVRVQLSDTLRGVVCQTLFHDELDGTQAPAIECMMATPAVRRAIRESQTHLLRGMMETGAGQGMRLMEASVADLVRQGRVSRSVALQRARDPIALERMI